MPSGRYAHRPKSPAERLRIGRAIRHKWAVDQSYRARQLADRARRRRRWLTLMVKENVDAMRLARAAVRLADADPRNEDRILSDTWDAHEMALSRRKK